jgi:hypothetical protein
MRLGKMGLSQIPEGLGEGSGKQHVIDVAFLLLCSQG